MSGVSPVSVMADTTKKGLSTYGILRLSADERKKMAEDARHVTRKYPQCILRKLMVGRGGSP